MAGLPETGWWGGKVVFEYGAVFAAWRWILEDPSVITLACDL